MKYKNKKRTIFISSIALLTFLLSSCQATPDEAAILKNKDAQGAFSREALPERVNEATESGNLKILINADISLPEADDFASQEVTKKVYSEEAVRSFVNEMTGGYETLYTDYKPSKSYWLNQISDNKLKGEKNEVYNEYLQNKYSSAPEQAEKNELDTSKYQDGEAVDVYIENKDGSLGKCSFNKNGNYIDFERDISEDFRLHSIALDEEEAVWLTLGDTPGISQEEAYKQAVTALGKINSELELYSAELCDTIKGSGSKTTGWSFTFTRKVNSLQKQYNYSSFGIDPSNAPSQAAPWEEEFFRAVIDKEGIVYCGCQGASSAEGASTEKVELAAFDLIKENAVKQLGYIYSSQAYEINITGFELCTDNLAMENEREKGRYIPLWMVKYTIKTENGAEESDVKRIYLNAVDGSYVEPGITTNQLTEALLTKN